MDYLYEEGNHGSAGLEKWALSLGFEVSTGDSANIRQVGWECGAVAAEAAFLLRNDGENFMNTNTSSTVFWDFVCGQYDWLKQQDANGHIDYSEDTLTGGSTRLCITDGSQRKTRYLGDEEISMLYERACSSTFLNEHFTIPGVHMLRLYLSYNTATSKIPRDDLIERCKECEPNYSPEENVPNKNIYMKWLQHKLRITKDLVETVTAMIISALPDGVTIHECKKVSLKLIHEELALTNCMYLSVSCAVSLPTNCSMKTIEQYLHR